jgi:hypothetical protein
LGNLFSSILCTCPKQRNLFNLTVFRYSGFLNSYGFKCQLKNKPCIPNKNLAYTELSPG